MRERAEIGLLDTSVVIDLGDLDPAALPVRSRVSAITVAELGLGVHTATGPERARRLERVQRVEAEFDPLPFTTADARRFVHLVGLVVSSGRSPRPRRQDLMIAATASIHRYPLFTRNPDDFVGLASALTVVAI